MLRVLHKPAPPIWDRIWWVTRLVHTAEWVGVGWMIKKNAHQLRMWLFKIRVYPHTSYLNHKPGKIEVKSRHVCAQCIHTHTHTLLASWKQTIQVISLSHALPPTPTVFILEHYIRSPVVNLYSCTELNKPLLIWALTDIMTYSLCVGMYLPFEDLQLKYRLLCVQIIRKLWQWMIVLNMPTQQCNVIGHGYTLSLKSWTRYTCNCN